MAYSNPRCRVLVFHTGRLVGTGTSGPDAARLAIARAQLQLAQEANVHLHVRNFAVRLTRASNPIEPLTERCLVHTQVINSVGAVSLRATLNCDAFAIAHSSESHFDRSSFVGLAVNRLNSKLIHRNRVPFDHLALSLSLSLCAQWRPPRESICCGTQTARV